MRKKLLFIQVLWTPYNHARFKAIAEECGNWDLHVFYQNPGSSYRKWNEKVNPDSYHALFLKNIGIPLRVNQAYTLNVNYNIYFELVKCRPDRVIISGWDSPATLVALSYCKLNRKEIILYSDSTVHEKSLPRLFFKPYVKTLIRQFDGFISGGTAAADYLKHLGAKKRIDPFYNTVDVDHFMKEGCLSKDRIQDEKTRRGIRHDSKVLMFSGRLVSIKHIDRLIEAYKTLRRERRDLHLVVVGYGPEMAKLQRLAGGLPDIHFLGHRAVNEIPALYAMADILVLPSIEEPWGLVVNEAMACRCAVVVSDRCGCSRDLISGNGVVFEGGNQEALTEALRVVLRSDAELEAMKEKSLEIICRFRPQDLVRHVSFFQ